MTLFSSKTTTSGPTQTFNWLTLGSFSAVVILFSQLVVPTFITVDLFPIYQNSIWSLLYFTHFVYLLLVISVILYVVPNLPSFTSANNFSKASAFLTLDGTDLLKCLLTLPLLAILLHTSWSGPALTAWFGHIEFHNFQFKLTYALYFFFATYLAALASNTHASSTNFFDYVISLFNFFVWLWFMLFSNNMFSFIFFLELLSAAVTLFLVTSSFSSSHFYNNLSFSKHGYFNVSTPTAMLQMLMLFFWITLVSSLMLFVFLITFYLKFLTLDLNLLSSVFTFLVFTASLKLVFATSFCWLLFLVCIFIKCGIVPFYLWKPAFFKGMSLNALFFYVYVYYFSIFLMFVYVAFFFLNEVFFFHLYVVIGFVVVATLGLPFILFESYYLKAFLALSSILNSVLIFYALCNSQASDVLFLI